MATGDHPDPRPGDDEETDEPTGQQSGEQQSGAEEQVPTGDPEMADGAPGTADASGAPGAMLEPRGGTVGDDALAEGDDRHASRPGGAPQSTTEATQSRATR